MPLFAAKVITSFFNINAFTYGNQWIVNNGDPITLYFQLYDANQATQASNSSGYFGSIFSGITPVGPTAGLRYLVGIGSNNNPYQVTVTFPSVDLNTAITLIATQVSPADSSIWSVSVPASQAICGGNIQFAIYQGNTINRFSVLNMLDVIFPANNGCC
jgi:hypothetical protein